MSGDNYPYRYSPRWEISRGHLSRGSIILGGNCLGAIKGVSFVWVAIIQGEELSGVHCPGRSCQGVIFLKVFVLGGLICSPFSRDYSIEFCHFSVVSILCKIILRLLDIVICPRRYFPHSISTMKNIWVTLDQREYKKYRIQKENTKNTVFLLRILMLAKNWDGNI